jgi:hypothetical protein
LSWGVIGGERFVACTHGQAGGRVPSDALQTFIRSYLGSIWELEVLLLLSRDGTHAWSAADLNREIRASLGLVSQILQKFEQVGLASREADGTFRFAPRSSEMARLVAELEEIYATKPVTIVKAISSSPNEKIQTLADAFKMKKD